MSSPKKVKSVLFNSLCGDAPPVITSAPGKSVKEITDNAPNENTFIHVKTGVVKFRDTDGSEHHSATVTPVGSGHIGTFKLGAVNQPANTVGWTFKLTDSVLDSMQEGQTIVQQYKVTIKDSHGGKDSAIVKVKIVGTNDVPEVIIDANEEGTDVNGFVFGQFSGPPGTMLADDDTFLFDDVDLLDTHVLSIIPDSGNTVGGTLTATITDPATGAGTGTIFWQYTVDNALVQALNSSTTETFQIRIDDLHGGVVFQPISVFVFPEQIA